MTYSSLSVNSISSHVNTAHVSGSVSVFKLTFVVFSFLYLSSLRSWYRFAVFESQSLIALAMVLAAKDPTYCCAFSIFSLNCGFLSHSA